MQKLPRWRLADTSDTVDFETGSIFFVGTATVILRYAGFTLLSDPNFLHRGDHVHLGYGLTAERLTEPAISLEQLPPVDLVLLSHLHQDHFDPLVARRLDRRMPIVTTVHGAFKLRRQGFLAVEGLETWESLTVAKGDAEVRIRAMPARHGPTFAAAALPPVNGSMLEFAPAGGVVRFRLYITGDTLVFDDLKQIPKEYPEIDLALVHLGGTRVFGVLLTMDGRQGVEALEIIQPRRAIPIHYDDYTVFRSPLSDFVRAVQAAGWSDRVTYLERGETYDFRVPVAGRTV